MPQPPRQTLSQMRQEGDARTQQAERSRQLDVVMRVERAAVGKQQQIEKGPERNQAEVRSAECGVRNNDLAFLLIR